jgi:cation diffusion facilitator family transporter
MSPEKQPAPVRPRVGGHGSTRRVVYAALAGNALVAITKAIAAFVTGSSAMLSESIHSLIDTGNELLLLYGLRRAARPPHPSHPLGHGRELYFWSFIVALLIFAVGAGVSILMGISRVRDPRPLENPLASYVVLALAFLFEGASWIVALRQFNAARGTVGFYQAFRESKDPPGFMVLFEDTAALLGILVAALGTFISVSLHQPVYDGVASILIGVILGGTSVLLARESKSLLIGEQADHALNEDILRIVSEDTVLRANGVMTFQLAPDQIVVALSIEFDDELNASRIEQLVISIEERVQAAHPEVRRIFVQPQTRREYAGRQARFEVEP